MTRLDTKSPQRLYSLDVLRGLAALSVVFWHWQHFFYSGTTPGVVEVEKEPLYSVFFLFYNKGWLAVDLFFSLSGFVFYWLYSSRIAERRITFRNFAVLRFSRLYPLHLATLLFVAIAQLWFIRTIGSPFIYQHNDRRHFLLNLLFTSSWGLESGYSFNAPIWSVSVEMLLYALFFVVCRMLPVRLLTLAAASIIGFLLITTIYPPVGRGVGSFFLGGCVFLAYLRLITSDNARRVTKFILYLASFAWLITLVVSKYQLNVTAISFQRVRFLWRLPTYFPLLDQAFLWATVVLFPLTILSLALIETNRGSLGKRCGFLGNISYSSYLLHFPLQMIVVMLATALAFDRSLFNASWFMALFFGVLILLSLASYYYFEAPMQKFLRTRWVSKRVKEQKRSTF